MGNWIKPTTVLFKEANSGLEEEGDAAGTLCPWTVLSREGWKHSLEKSSQSCHHRTSPTISWVCSQCQGTGIYFSLGVCLTSMSLTRSSLSRSPDKGHPAKVSDALDLLIDFWGHPVINKPV